MIRVCFFPSLVLRFSALVFAAEISFDRNGMCGSKEEIIDDIRERVEFDFLVH